MTPLASLRSLRSFRPGIAYVLDALYLAPTARSPAARTMRSCRGSRFARKDSGLAPLPASRAAQQTASGSGFEPLPDGAREPTAAELDRLVREWVAATGSARVVFQGDGDPLAAADVVVETLRLAEGSGAAFRVNTLGIARGADVDALLASAALVDTVSVFLPAADAATYDALLRPRAAGGFEAACAFVRRAAASGMRVEVTAVDRPDVAVADVEALAGRLGATDFRTRSWLGSPQRGPV